MDLNITRGSQSTISQIVMNLCRITGLGFAALSQVSRELAHPVIDAPSERDELIEFEVVVNGNDALA